MDDMVKDECTCPCANLLNVQLILAEVNCLIAAKDPKMLNRVEREA